MTTIDAAKRAFFASMFDDMSKIVKENDALNERYFLMIEELSAYRKENAILRRKNNNLTIALKKTLRSRDETIAQTALKEHGNSTA
jgi:hypothetical protein